MNQVIGSTVHPLSRSQLHCSGSLQAGHIAALLSSRERTQRYTGVKLARLRNEIAYRDAAMAFVRDGEEDVYIRLEAASFLNATCRDAAGPLFNPYLTSADEQTQLEAVIALGEAATDEAIELLCAILADAATPYFLRSAAAWSLSRTASPRASDHLVSIFSDVDLALRQEALDGLVAIGDAALPILLRGLRNADDAIAAGCAEALRRARSVPGQLIESLISELQTPRPRSWAIWLAGNLPREHFSTAIAQLQQQNPELHFALSVLWSFIESWIARNWELRPTPHFPEHPGR